MILTRLLLLSFVVLSTWVSSQEIIWYTDDKADIKKNLFQDSPISISSDTTTLLLKSLPKYRFDFQYAPIPRISYQLIKLENACVANRIKTPSRSRENIFSLPLNFYPSLRLYYLKSNISIAPELLNTQRQLTSLTQLFQHHPNTILAIEKGRSMGPSIDNIIPKINKNNLFIRSGNDSYEALSNLLFIKRVDFILAYPTAMKERIAQAGLANDIVSIELANIENYIISHIACSKSAIGQQFITEVDLVLKQLYFTADFENAHLRHLNIAEHQIFKAYLTFFRQQMLMSH